MTPTPNPRYVHIRHEHVWGLVAMVDPKLQEGIWECLGAPFFDRERNEWVQALVRPHRDPAAAAKGKR